MNSFDLSDLNMISYTREGLLSHLENHFADPLSFLRELVQNAIDAGSSKVEVTCVFEKDKGGTDARSMPAQADELGTAIIRVADFGEGMDRNIIDTHLTRLFSSEKEGDQSKIGRFGIGFSSVFLLKPDAVCVDTGRYGENWRLVFRPNRTFTRVRLSEPIEGTTIRLFKAMVHSDFEALERSLLRALYYYCPHVDMALYYQGVSIGSALNLDALDAPIKGSIFEQDAEIVVGFTRDGSPDTASFYNRGLMVLVRPSELPGICYKINSPRLEPTLGRDFVIPNEHYRQVLLVVRRLASGSLVEQLAQRLDEALRQGHEEPEIAALQRPLATLLRLGASLPAACAQRAVACSPHGHLYTLLACEEAMRDGQLFGASHPSPLSAAVCAAGQVVLEDWQGDLLSALCHGEPPRLERVLVLPLAMKESERVLWMAGESLRAATLALLKSVGAPVSVVELGYLDYPGSGAGSLPAVVQAQPFTVSKLAGALPRDQSWSLNDGASLGQHSFPNSGPHPDRPGSTWVLNADHPMLRTLLPLALREPELAAYSMIKLCLLGGPFAPELESELLTQAMMRRCQRQEAPLTERLVASLTKEGVIDSPGAFTINPELARERIRRTRLPNPLRYILNLVQAASIKGATRVSFRFGAGDLQMYFDGAPFMQRDFEQLHAALLSKESAGDSEARRLLARGLFTALQVDSALIQVESGNAFIELRPGRPDRRGFRTEAAAQTHIRIQQRLNLGLIRRYIDHLGGHLTEEVLLQERCVHARMVITIDGRPISQGHMLSGAMPWKTFTLDNISGAVDVAPLPIVKSADSGVQMSPELELSPPLLRLIQNEVWVDTQLPIELLPGFRALAESSIFRLDISGEHVVQDDTYAAALRAVAAAQVELLASQCRRYLIESAVPKEAQEQPALPLLHLGALLRGLLLRPGGLGALVRWAKLPIEQFPPASIAEGNPGWPAELEDGAALLDIPIFPCTTGELVSLRRLLADFAQHRTVLYSVHGSHEPNVHDRPVLYIAESGSELLARGLFGAALECHDPALIPALTQGWEHEHPMGTWQRRTYQHKLGSQTLIARVPLIGLGLTGEIGCEPHRISRAPWQRRLGQPCALRILFLKEGTIFIDKVVPFPVPNLIVMVTGDFAESQIYDDVLSDSQLGTIMEAVFSAVPLLLEQLVLLGGISGDGEGVASPLARDDETMTWWACVLRRLLTLALSAEARRRAWTMTGASVPPDFDPGGTELHPHPLWSQLREMPIFEALDGSPLRASDLEAAAARCGYLALLCPSPNLHPQQLEQWAALCSKGIAPTESWRELDPTASSAGASPAAILELPAPFVLWLAPEELALREPLSQQLSPAQIVNAELWLRVAATIAAANSQPRETLSLPVECELSVPLSDLAGPSELAGVEGLLGIKSASALASAHLTDPRVAVDLFHNRNPLGSHAIWLPGGQFLSAVADHPQLRPSADSLEVAEGEAMVAVRTALAAALPKLFTLLSQRELPWSLHARMVLLEAVTALFPSLTFRLAYERLGAIADQESKQGAAEAERDYVALLGLALATSLGRVDAVLERHMAQAGPLHVGRVTWDVVHGDASTYGAISAMAVAARPETDALAQAPALPAGAMAWIDVLYPGCEGSTMAERVLNVLPALAEAPLLLATSGAPITLAEVIRDFRQHGHVLYSAGKSAQAATPAQRPIICDLGKGLRHVLCRLFGSNNVWNSNAPQHRLTLAPRPAEMTATAQSSSEGLLVAVEQELRVLTEKNKGLVDSASGGWLKMGDREDASAVAFENQQCIINGHHPAVQLAQRRFAADPQYVRFLASAVYTTLSSGLGSFNSEESGQFHHHLALRALTSLRGPSA